MGLFVLGLGGWGLFGCAPKNNISLTPTQSVTPAIVDGRIYPIAQFTERITKKPFGIFITPKNSPAQPERFTGYHTGVDVEYEDLAGDVPVYATCDGEIVLHRRVSGYGGTVVLKCIDNYILYGHLKVDSIIKKTTVSKGELIAILGRSKTKETDFERKHLHYGIHKNTLDLRGYVQIQSELKDWIDPIE